MEWIFLSPHLDDAVLSCGGLIWEQVHAGDRVTVLTICAGAVPDRPLSAFAQELHERWKTGVNAVEIRHAEDQNACDLLGAFHYHMEVPDCIYRFQKIDGEEHPLIQVEADLRGVQPESDLVERLSTNLLSLYPAEAKIICPLALGGHVDHRLTRAAAELSRRVDAYYADYPYILWSERELNDMELGLLKRLPHPISITGMAAWQDAIAAYDSQISTFWQDEREVRLCVKNYWGGGGGRLWTRA